MLGEEFVIEGPIHKTAVNSMPYLCNLCHFTAQNIMVGFLS